jgi:co-chaperonin GroES (HSP10)
MSLLVDKLRPLHDWLLVKRDPPQPRSTIILDPGNEGSSVRTGVVLKVGYGKHYPNGTTVPVGVEVGEHIAFFRWHQEHRPGKATTKVLKEIAEELGVADDVVLIRENDILFAFDGDLKVDVG